jgi:hypothetical protein
MAKTRNQWMVIERIDNPAILKICYKFDPKLIESRLYNLPFSAIGELLKILQISYGYLCSKRFGWENIL